MPEEGPAAPINRELAAKITAAYVRRNQVASDQLGTLISTVHQALADLGKQPPESGGERTPGCRSVDPFIAIMSSAWNAVGAA